MSNLSERIAQLSPKRVALLALELDERLEALERTRREPIAIVGMACRFPGGAATPEAFWRVLRDRVDAIREVPADRWDIDRLYHPDPDSPGRMSTRWGGFLDGWDLFDPHFFGISPREAQGMDPQQRVFLEVAWEALERAGQAPDGLHGSSTGVFAGVCNSDYGQLLMRQDLSILDAYFASGNAFSVLAGRLSYILGLQGPAVSIDTACSSSLVAVHLACQSLRLGECRMAIAGGVNYIGAPEVTVALSKAHMMAPDGRCKAFDASADGFVRGEGCGVIVLKRLSDAEADGDTVLAVIRGSAANQDGRSSGLTAPNGPSQEAVIAAALASANLSAGDVDYVEAHGTGTSLGDPIEARALGAAYGAGRTAATPLAVGSVKTNIGHLESAAGIAGIIKVVLALQQEEIPPQLHFRQPSPHIDWEHLPISVVADARPWRRSSRARVAGVSSFGFSGTNAHVLLGEAPAREGVPAEPARPIHVLTVSARSTGALRQLATSYADRLEAPSAPELADVCFTATAGRAHFAERIAVVAASREAAARELRAWAAGEPAPGVQHGETATAPPDIAFLFTGQGSQYVGMGRELYGSQPVFTRVLDTCDEILRADLPVPLKSAILGDGPEGILDDTGLTQPALFAIEYALAEMWRSWGVRPAAVMGHSVGEFVAACVSGVLGLEDALRLIAVRGRLMSALPAGGKMSAVFAPLDQIERAIADSRARVSVAAVNGPDNTVLSGDAATVDRVSRGFAAAGIKVQPLVVSHAFHSPLMEPMLAAFAREARRVSFAAPRVAYASNLTGKLFQAGEVPDADYWCRHVMAPVQFAASVRALFDAGHRVFLEVGPTPTLLGMARRCIAGDAAWLPSLRKGKSDWLQLAESLGALYVRGVPVQWDEVHAPRRGTRVSLPTYPFRRQRFWALDGTTTRPATIAPRAEPVHPLLGSRLDTPGMTFEALFDVDALPVLRDHRVGDTFVVPGPVYIEMAAAAASQVFGEAPLLIETLAIRDPLVVAAGVPRRVQTLVKTAERGVEIQIFSAEPGATPGAGWTLHATATVRASSDPAPHAEPAQQVRARCAEEIEGAAFVSGIEERGIEIAAGRAIQRIWRRDGEALALLAFDGHIGGARSYLIDPAVLDAATLVVGAAAPESKRPPREAMSVLAGIDAVQVLRAPGSRAYVHAVVNEADRNGAVATLTVTNEDGTIAVRVEGLRITHLSGNAAARLTGRHASDDWLYEIQWRHVGDVGAGAPLADAASVAARLEPSVDSLWHEHGFAEYATLLPALERLCAAYAARALRELGAPETDVIGALPSLLERFQVANRHHRLFERLMEMLVEDGIVVRGGAEWSWGTVPDVVPDRLAEELVASHPAFAPQVNLTAECGRNLAAVLRGRTDPLHLLFPGGSFSATEHLYEHSPSARIYNALVRKAIGELTAGWPAGRTLRCLEVGAGTGGTTSAVLPSLPAGCAEYHYTDVSKLFMSRAAEKFRAYPFVRHGLLDIEQDPAAQGYESGTFDLVVAANVVHATAGLRRTIANVRRLLAPGGVLVLVEGTERQRWVDLTFGLLEGWWKFSDRDVRPSYPLLSREGWAALLHDGGFAPCAFAPARVDAPQAIILARTTATGRHAAPQTTVAPAIVIGDTHRGAALVSSLIERGRRAILCETSDALAPVLREHVDGPCDVLYAGALRSLSPAGSADMRSSALQACIDVPAVLNSMLREAPEGRLWMVTEGAQMVDAAPRPVAPAGACVWGLGRVIALEHPDIWGGLIDLDPDPGSRGSHGQMIDTLLRTAGDEDQIAIRNESMYAPRLTRSSAAAAVGVALETDGTYLVTGAFGGLGLKVARWLASCGAGHLVLISRHAVDPRHASSGAAASPTNGAAEAIREMEALGATVHVVAADSADREQMAALFSTFGTAMPPLRGIIHTAVQMSARPVRDLDAAALRDMFLAKVDGTTMLHELSAGQPLDFFVMFSSTTALWGVAGLGHYAAANAYMDALAHERRRTGRPALSVNWGTWDEMRVASAAERKAFAQGGLLAMDSESALALLGRLLNGAAPQNVVASVDWSVLKTVYEARRSRPFFREIAVRARAERGDERVTARGIADQLREAPPAERRERLVAYIRGEVASVLGLPPGEAVPLAQGLFEMGMDSLMSVELKSRLERGLSHPLPSTLTFNYPNIGALAAFLEAEVLGGASADVAVVEAAAPPPRAEPSAEDRDELSEDQLAGLLAQRLNRLGR